MRSRTRMVSPFLFASLFPFALGAWADGVKIISVRDGEITLSNLLGISWRLMEKAAVMASAHSA